MCSRAMCCTTPAAITMSTPGALVSLVGVDDLVVVQTKDATLVARRDQVQEVKKIVERLKQQGRTEHHVHREVYRPWGKYDAIDKGHRFQVKHISVRPRQGLSRLQSSRMNTGSAGLQHSARHLMEDSCSC